MPKGVFALLLALGLGMGTAYAYTFSAVYSGKTLYFNITDATNQYVEITYPGTSTSNPWNGYPKPTGSITLPSNVTYNGVTYTVKKIGNYAFYQCGDLTGSLAIPNTVTSIGNHAFDDCYGFSGTLTLSNSLTTIGDYAFNSCCSYGLNQTSFTGTLTIPNSVVSIGDYAFYSSFRVNGSTLTIGNSVTTIGDLAFGCCSGFGGSLTIPNSVSSIGYSAFEACSGFTGTLTIGTGVTSLDWHAFSQCTGFTQVNYNATNCADISSNDTPFIGCGGILTIDSNVARIPSYMFDETSFTQVNFNATNCADACSPSPFKDCGGPLIIGNNVMRIPAYMFYECVYFTSLSIGNSVTTIGTSAFQYCSSGNNGLSGNLVIPNSVTTIGSNAFEDCSHYSGYTLTIGTGVTLIGTSAFRLCDFSRVNFNANNCADFTSNTKPFEECTGTIAIGSNVQRIPAHLTKGASFTQVNYNAINCADITSADKPYEGCSGSLSIGSNVQRIPAYMFINCTDFTSTLTIPYSVTVIGDYAFYRCFGLTGTLTIPTSMVSIGDNAFRFCSGFTGSLTLPNSLSSIGYATFLGCTGLTGMLTIPNSVSSIGQYAFKDCSNLTSVKVNPETPPTLSSNVFDNVPKSIPVYVPCASLEDYQTASGWSEFTNYQCNFTVTVTAIPTVGGSVTGGGTYTSGSSVTVTAAPNSNYLFMHWTVDGTVVSSNPSYTFTVTEDTELEAAFMSTSYAGDIIGEATSSSVFLPSHSFYRYSLTEQIYRTSELGGSTTITSISFFNEGATKTRTYDIYLMHTPRTNFSSDTDWISVTSSNKVFSGSVTMRAGMWTTIILDTPFTYNGTSNLLLAVDDNTGTYTSSPHMQCRVFNATNDFNEPSNQTLRIYSDGTNYDPFSPSSYAGVRMTVKNQIMLNRPGSICDINVTPAKSSAGTVSGGGQYFQGDVCTLKATANSGYTFVDWADASGVVVSTDAYYSFTVTTSMTLTAHFMSGTDFCSLTFDLFDSYGDGWNGNQLVVDFENGMSTKLAAPEGVSKATYTLPVETNTEVELSWIEGGWTSECSFAVSYTDGEVMYVATDLDANFTYEFDMDCSGQPSELVYLGDHSKANNYYLPSYSFYNYSLSEQIYTADEIGEAGLVNSIAFYNAGAKARTRTYQIYLATTNKTAFSSQTDWISTSDATLVYDGSVTMHAGRWTPILFSTPFDYDGVSNLVLIVDDNTGSYTSSPYMSCLVYPTSDCQALRIFSDGTNYDPASPSSYTGTLQNVKNQIMLNIASCVEPLDLTVTDITPASANIDWTSDHYSFELQYRKMDPNNDFENGFGLWTTIDADGDGYNWYYTTSVLGHDGSVGLVESESWCFGTVLTPDNYLVSPQTILGGSISFWASAQDNEWVAEHFGVAVSTTGNTNPADFTIIQEWTMTAKSEGAKTGITRSGNRTQGTWYQYTVDLSAYAGQTGYVAIRHFNSTDMFRLNVDDITVVQPGVNSSWTTDYHATSPYALTDLTPGIQYEVRVRSICVGDYYSDWGYTTFTTTAICPPEDKCELTFTLTDSYGDGWNGAAIQVFDAATNILLASMSAPSHGLTETPTTDTYTLAVCDGRELRFEWVNGSYDSECSYIVTDVNGIEVFSGSGAFEPVTYMVDCSQHYVFLTNGNWNNGSCWNTGTVPPAGSDVIIQANATVPVGYLAVANAVSLDGGSITVADGGQLKHNTQGLEVTMKKNIVGYDDANDIRNYYLLAFPFVYTGIPAAMSATGSDFYRFDPSEPNAEWRNLRSEPFYINILHGYLFASPESYELSLTGNTYSSNTETSWDHVVEYTEGSANPYNGWELLGTPLTYNVYIYRETSDGELVPMEVMIYDENGDIQTITCGPIAPMQGFFVHVTEETTVCFRGEAHINDYVDLGLPSGTLWATCNVGANSPEDYGDYFAWGETQPKDNYNWDTYQYGDGATFTKYTGSDGLTTLLPEDDAATANWGSGWRMPTNEEWQELYNNTTMTWTQQNGVNVKLFTAVNGNSLFLPAAGYRYNSNLNDVGSWGFYWSSSLYTDYLGRAWYFYFSSSIYNYYGFFRYNGQSVRPVRSSGQN